MRHRMHASPIPVVCLFSIPRRRQRRTALGQLPFTLEQAIPLGGRGERKGTECVVPFDPTVLPCPARPLIVALEPFAPLPHQKRFVSVLVGDDTIPVGGGGDAVRDVVDPRTDPRSPMHESLPGIIEDRPAKLPHPEPMLFFDLECLSNRVPSEVPGIGPLLRKLRLRTYSQEEHKPYGDQHAQCSFGLHLSASCT